jgi:hypothetical protein
MAAVVRRVLRVALALEAQCGQIRVNFHAQPKPIRVHTMRPRLERLLEMELTSSVLAGTTEKAAAEVADSQESEAKGDENEETKQ